MKRFLSMVLLAAILLPAASAFAVKHFVKKQLMIGATGAQPAYLQYNARTDRMYCGNTGSMAGIRYIDCAADSMLGQVAGVAPGLMVCDTFNNRIYLHDNGVNFYAINCALNTRDTSIGIGQGGGPVDFNPVNNKIYHLDQTFSTIYAINAAAYSYVSFAGSSNLLYFQPANVLYTGQGFGDSLAVLSGLTNAQTAAINIPGLTASTKKMAANPALNRLYVALNNIDSVAVVNTATNTLVARLPAGDNPAAFALCPVNNRMFVACNGSSQYSLRYLNSLDGIDSVHTGDSVNTVMYNPKDSLIYIGCWRSGYVKLVDPRLPQPAVIDSVYLGTAMAHPVALSADNGGDVYVAPQVLDYLEVIAGDTIAPIGPETLRCNGGSPSPWLGRADSLATVSWTNPFDPSGIWKAYYKVATPPASNIDFTDSAVLSGASFPLPVRTLTGSENVYVWLADSSGNADYRTRAMVVARRDTVLPSGIRVKAFVPDTVGSTVVTVNWTPGSFGPAKMMGYSVRYRADTLYAPWDTVMSLLADTTILFTNGAIGHQYSFEATGRDSAGNWQPLTGVGQASVFLKNTLDTMAPTVTVTAPALGTVWQNQMWDTIRWTDNDLYGLIRRELYYQLAPGQAWVCFDTIRGSQMGAETRAWYVPYLLSTQARIKVVVYNQGGVWAADSSQPFTIRDTIPPVVFSIMPFNADSAVGVLAQLQVSFSEAIQDTSFRFTLYPATGGLQATWNTYHDQLILAHQPFKPGTNYAFTVTGARDLAGNLLVGTGQSLFTTRPQRTYTSAWQGGRYRLFSLPLAPLDTASSSALAPSLGSYSDSTWRMFDLDAQRQLYGERPVLRPGRGYWLSSIQSTTLSIAGSSNDSVSATLELWPGWNLVGAPFSNPLKLGMLNIYDDAGVHHYYYQPGTALNDSLVRQRMWTYSDSSANLTNDGIWTPHSATDTAAYLMPWQGYAVYAVRHCVIDFIRLMGKQAPPAATPPPEITWRLTIDAAAGAGADRGLELGLSPQALEGYDRMDAEKPPLVSSEITASIPHPEWRQGPCGSYQYDYRPASGYIEWPLAVRQNDPARAGTLRLTTSGALPAGQRAYLVDRKLGTATEIESGAIVSFTGSREFAVISTNRSLGDLRLKPLAFGLDRLYPNPFMEQAVISYQVPTAGRVTLKVYNIAGQLVATLADGEQQPGYYAARWNGRTQGQYAAASGVYLVRLSYGNQTRTEKLVKVR